MGDLFRQLEEEYAPRRKRYRSYLKGLRPATSRDPVSHTVYDENDEDVADSAPRPLPLNPTLHRFFLELFRR